MFKILPLLVLLVVVNCQIGTNSDSEYEYYWEEVTDDSFVNKKVSSTLKTSINSDNSGQEDLSCKMRDGTVGQCVNYYLCDENNTIIDDGAGVIDGTISTGTSSDTDDGRSLCASYLDICCVPRDRRAADNPIESSPQSTMNYKILQEVIGSSRRKATKDPLVDNKKPSTFVPSIHGKNEDKEHLSCTMEDDITGQCVPYYLCGENNTIVDDDAHVIDMRTSGSGMRNGSCVSYHVCCLPRNIKSKDSSIHTQLQPAREGCGWRNPRGVDLRTTDETTEKAKFGEFPWMVAIMKIEPVNETKPDGQTINVYLCGGSLISYKVVLTAAHSVAVSSALKIRAGDWNVGSTKEIYPFQDRDVESVELHKDFNERNLFYDVALLFVSEPVTPAPNVGVVCLPPPQKRTPAGTQCFATGWGKDKYGREGRYQTILKKVELQVVKRNACQTALRSTQLGRFFQLHTSFMCAGGEGKGTCLGDQGSPLSCPIPYEEGRYIQSGIVAWGIKCGENGTPSVYVDVSTVRDWIDDKMVSKGLNPRIYTI